MVKHRRVLQLTLLASALLPLNFVFNWMFYLPLERVACGIFQIANIVPILIK